MQLLILKAVVEPSQIVIWEILPAVDTTVILYEAFLGDFLLDVVVVQIRVEHDQREREDVRRV